MTPRRLLLWGVLVASGLLLVLGLGTLLAFIFKPVVAWALAGVLTYQIGGSLYRRGAHQPLFRWTRPPKL